MADIGSRPGRHTDNVNGQHAMKIIVLLPLLLLLADCARKCDHCLLG